jgi:hypothetical protein
MNKNTNTKSSVPKMNLTKKPSSNSFGREKISAHTIIMIIGIVFSSILFSCQPKKDKKELVIYNNNQNYKYDSNELAKNSSNDTKYYKIHLGKNKKDKLAVKK